MQQAKNKKTPKKKNNPELDGAAIESGLNEDAALGAGDNAPGADGGDVKSPPPQPGPDQVLGQIARLLLASPAHRHLFMADWEWLILPPVAHRQFRIFRRKGRPFAYVSWAFLNEDAAARISAGEIKMRPDEWTSGEELWLIDLITPFGGADTILKEVRENVLPGRKIKSLQPAPDGNGHAMVEW